MASGGGVARSTSSGGLSWRWRRRREGRRDRKGGEHGERRRRGKEHDERRARELERGDAAARFGIGEARRAFIPVDEIPIMPSAGHRIYSRW